MILQIVITFLLTVTPNDHDFKMSVCEITYVETQSRFEVKLYLFQDDLKEAIYGDPHASELKPEDVSSYISTKVKLTVDGQPMTLSLQEIKEKEDQAMVVFYSEKLNISLSPKMVITNQLLLEKFRQQTNMVYLLLPGRAKITQIIIGSKTEATL